MPKPTAQKTQQQDRQPGIEADMQPRPEFIRESYRGSGKLDGQHALITGGDSGIGRAVAVHFAAEGAAAVGIVYLDEHGDADETARLVREYGRGCECVPIQGDITDPDCAPRAVDEFLERTRSPGLDILVNNAAAQWPQDTVEEIELGQLERTFRTNIFSYFLFTQAALPHMARGGSIVNTASVTAYRGSPKLIDYSATKGAITTFTRSLSISLAERGIRVNGVAPGPIWTPLIPASFDAEKVKSFGKDTPMKRAGQPSEVGPCYVFLCSADASYMTGQTLHPNGGSFVAT
jgi:NAD(P)-dependent dehydrogenase (short-subunit alcohol dehydrogenase family)